MSPGDPALAMPIPAPFDDAVPDYVQALERAADYLPEAQRALLRRAWAVGAAAHAGQMRKSGEPYITHPVAVAQVLAEQGLDVETLVAAILHDTIEDTPLSRGDIAQQFGETVAELSMASPSWTSCTSPTARKRRRRASARCCWRCRATCGSS